MAATIIAELISCAVTLVGVLIANSRTQAMMDTKIEELTREEDDMMLCPIAILQILKSWQTPTKLSIARYEYACKLENSVV